VLGSILPHFQCESTHSKYGQQTDIDNLFQIDISDVVAKKNISTAPISQTINNMAATQIKAVIMASPKNI
jgi:hypothetical protein